MPAPRCSDSARGRGSSVRPFSTNERAPRGRTDTLNEFTTAICRKDAQLTFVVNESCIRCKIMDCVDVCPVDCFYEGENMLVIHPDECIDCGVCVPECPVDAIKPDTEPGLEKWLSLNAEYAKIWPNITVKKATRPTLRSGRGSRTNSNTSHQIPRG